MADYRKMRRADREITDFSDILDVLRRADTIRLGLNGDPYPYVVPLSYGFEADAGRDAPGAPRVVYVYVHGAAEGYKHDLIARDNRACVEAGIFHRYAAYGEGGAASVTTEYESVIGFGTVEAVTGGEAARGMDLILEHCGFPGFAYETPPLSAMLILKITLTHISGKRRFL